MKHLNRETMQLWDEFVHKFTPEYIKNKMTMDEYVIGKGSNNKSFCYIVERSLGDVGGIRGATSSKFGLYYSKAKGDYIPTKRFGKTKEEAFEVIKTELASLVERTQKLNKFKDLDSIFNGMFKYKIMYLYSPAFMVPSFVEGDLKYFALKLNLKPQNSYEKLQIQLLDYYYNNKSSEYSDIHSFMHYLYDKYGRNVSNKVTRQNHLADEELKEKMQKCNLKSLDNFVPSSNINGYIKGSNKLVYKRDPRCSLKALINAKNKCELSNTHYCFERRKDGTGYTEAHHLIPMQFQDEFLVNIDRPENIVSLCSNCHNEIHYGKNADALITILYNKRKALLESIGINITLKELLVMYHNINK